MEQTKQLTVYVVEDDFLYQEKIKNTIDSLALSQSLTLKTVAVPSPYNFYKDLENIEIQDNDVFILDIDLNTYFSGVQMAEKIRSINEKCFILFITNFDDRGIDIINRNIHAHAYILKTLKHESDIRLTITKIFHAIKNEILQRSGTTDETIMIKINGENIVLPSKKILYISSVKGLKNALLIKTTDREYMIEGSLRKMKDTLEQDYFYKDLRSYVINLTAITSFNRTLETITFYDGTDLQVGTRIVDKIKKAL